MASLVSLWSYRISLFESLSRVPVKLHDIDFRCVAISLSASYSLPDSQFSLASASAPVPNFYSCDFVGLTAIRFRQSMAKTSPLLTDGGRERLVRG